MATLLSSTPSSSSHLLLRKNPNPYPRPLHLLSISSPLRPSLTRSSLAISASLVSPPPPLFSTSTRTITSLLSLVFSFSRSLATSLTSSATSSSAPLFASTSSLFFARSSSSLNTPMTVVAAGMAKWLDLYSGVLMVRVLLSWFPNIPWDRQPLSAIRDLCDPYLSLFRNIIPPVFDTLDVSPLLAFGVLGVLSSILTAAVH